MDSPPPAAPPPALDRVPTVVPPLPTAIGQHMEGPPIPVNLQVGQRAQWEIPTMLGPPTPLEAALPAPTPLQQGVPGTQPLSSLLQPVVPSNPVQPPALLGPTLVAVPQSLLAPAPAVGCPQIASTMGPTPPPPRPASRPSMLCQSAVLGSISLETHPLPLAPA